MAAGEDDENGAGRNRRAQLLLLGGTSLLERVLCELWQIF